jgi:thiamine-phosphate pyrophosphorylase
VGADRWWGRGRIVWGWGDPGPLAGRPVRQGLAMNGSERPATARAREVVRGLYAITPDWADTATLLAAVEATLGAGTRLLQYRNKVASPEMKREQLTALISLCERHGCTLVVNDDWRLALELGIRAVHIGGDDGDVQEVRAALGPEVILGVSCYADLERARLVASMADYLAFGSVFPSTTKPTAASAALQILGQARSLGLPVVAIGGIDQGNARSVLEAGADAIAVISGLFGGAAVAEATEAQVSGATRALTRIMAAAVR